MTSKGKLFVSLQMLGVSPKMDTFSYRKVLQKIVYLLQKSGMDFDFSYSWYLHGPYSPDLTRTLYEMGESSRRSTDKPNDLEIARINKLKSFLGEDIHSSDKLELLVSIDYLRTRARIVGASDDEVLATLKRAKPYFSEGEIHEFWKKSIELGKLFNR